MLTGIVVPRGYLITKALGTTLAPGGQDTFTITLNTSVVGYFCGQIQVISSDVDEPIYNISIEGMVTSQAIETLTLGIAKRTIADSGTTIAKVARSGNLDLPLRVNLTNDRPSPDYS